MAERDATVRPIRRAPEPLWREALGDTVRRLRQRRRLTLTGAAAIAGISPQYLSEIERGHKDPSSEVVAAIAGALDLTLADVTDLTTRQLRATQPETRSARRALARPVGPVALAA